MTAPEARDDDAVEERLISYLSSRTNTLPRRGDDLFKAGVITSLLAMELVLYLEQTFGIAIEGDDLDFDNFRSIAAMVDLVRRLRDIPVRP